MGKDKKKHSKKDKASDDLLDVATLSIKKFRKVTKEIGKLSTGQKLVGGIALAAAGLAYLAARDTDAPAESKSEDADVSPRPDSDDEPTKHPRKSRKRPRPETE